MTFPVELPIDSYRGAKLANVAASSGYAFETAGALAWLAQLTYETRNEKKVSDVLLDWQLSLIVPFRNPVSGVPWWTSTHGLIVRGWGATIVAFAGTDLLKPRDWITDFCARLSPEDVHSGFEAGVEAVWPEIEQAVGEHHGADGRLLFAGHSMGGSMAAVAARFAHDRMGVGADSIYTFGMPRCGGPAFAQAYEASLGSRTYRLVHGDDIVPTVPPSEAGFRHVGRLLKCSHDGSFRTERPLQTACDEPQFSRTALDGIRDMLGDIFDELASGVLGNVTQPGFLGLLYSQLPTAIGDHISSRYLQALGFDP